MLHQAPLPLTSSRYKPSSIKKVKRFISNKQPSTAPKHSPLSHPNRFKKFFNTRTRQTQPLSSSGLAKRKVLSSSPKPIEPVFQSQTRKERKKERKKKREKRLCSKSTLNRQDHPKRINHIPTSQVMISIHISRRSPQHSTAQHSGPATQTRTSTLRYHSLEHIVEYHPSVDVKVTRSIEGEVGHRFSWVGTM